MAVKGRKLTLIALAVPLLTAWLAPVSLCQSALVDRPKRDLLSVVTVTELDSSTKELAQQLEIWQMLVELYDKEKPPTSENARVLRQKIRETILESYFDAASVQAEAQREQARVEELRETLFAKRDHNVALNNATNFIASGTLNTVGSILGFSNKEPAFPGNLNQMLSGVVSTGMSVYALKQSKGGKIHGQGTPTVLAELFGRPTNDRSSYPESVWRFFHGLSPEAPGITRAQFLEKRWISAQHLDKPGTRHAKLKIDLVCGAVTDQSMNIDDLSDEIAMISDVGDMASLMTHHLRDLLRMIDSDVIVIR